MKTVKIKYLNCVPGMGGINYDYLSSIGWTPETLCPVLREYHDGYLVKIPNKERGFFVFKCEAEEIN